MENPNNIPEVFFAPYNPNESERTTQELWDSCGFSNPDNCIAAGVTPPNAEPFSMVLPPPNVTGVLHTGHTLELSIQDTMVRFARMNGKRTLWIPGTDHAAIATQSKVEKILEKEGLRKHDMSRDDFLDRVNAFAQSSHDTIVNQVKAFGASVDWSREAYTLDDQRNLAVRTAFKTMYDDGLIYRGYRIVNWDPKGQTTISDDEIVNEERASKLYTFKYSHEFPIAIATTRPETKVGDVAVAVNPNDARYAQYVGNEYDCIFCGVPIHIKIIADNAAEAEFGTGALGVTPAHSQIDWEMSQRHGLEVKPVINEYARMIVGDERILDKKTTDAREVIVNWLREEGLMIAEEDITQNVPTAERTGAVIEPLPKLQWFINVNKEFTLRHSEIQGIESGSVVTLKQLMLAAVQSNQISILPNRFETTYFNWINNLRDWCISRQIWFGHRIPVWYRGEEVYSGIEAPEDASWTQDEDTLDTWFSSGLWTFSTLGWPNKTKDFETYHPTTCVDPAYEILFFWVARMILMSTYLLGVVPFKTVYLHGIVRAKDGRKMSKSMGNEAVDPLEVMTKYGADSLRMAMIVGSSPGQDTKLYDEKLKAYSKFANKLWNMTRFVLENTDTSTEYSPADYMQSEWAQNYASELQNLVTEITPEMNEYKYYLVAEKLYHYTWHTFADKIIEESRPLLTSENSADKKVAQSLLVNQLTTSLKLLHPFMPHITETIWQQLPKAWKVNEQSILMVAQWPTI